MRRLIIALLAVLWATPASAQLSLSDFVTPAGQTLVMAFVGVSGGPVPGGGPWDRYVWGPTGQNAPGGTPNGSIAEGNGDLAPDLTVAAIRCDNVDRCQFRMLPDGVGFATYFENPPALYDDGTWYWQDDTEVLTAAASDVSDGRVGTGFLDFITADSADLGAITAKMWELVANDRFILAFTRPAPSDNCDIYIGAENLTAPSNLRIGTLTPLRVYLGSTRVCGDAP